MKATMEEGYEANGYGESKFENPYEPGTINFDDWNYGWEEAQEDRREYFDSISPLRPEDY